MSGLVSIVLPAHNEARTVGDVVRQCTRATPGLAEVIVVDDGSTDATSAVARSAGARVHRLDRNSGKGVALRAGIERATAEVIVVLDADGQDDPSDIPVLLDALDPDVDLVIGSRFLGRFEAGAITPIDRAGNRLLTGVVNVLYRVRLTDTQAGFRAMRRSSVAAARLRARTYDIESDLLAGILLAGGTVVEVPVRRRPRAHGNSDLRNVRDGLRILARIVARRWQLRPSTARR